MPASLDSRRTPLLPRYMNATTNFNAPSADESVMEGKPNGELQSLGVGTTQSQKRVSLKSRTHLDFTIWKSKLRENCYKRVREDRTRLLWRMRMSDSHSSHEDFIKSTFEDIVSDELGKIKGSLGDSSKLPDEAHDVDDMLWEYDRFNDTSDGEREEIMLEMQRIFYEDLRAEVNVNESRSQIETWEDDEDEYLAHAILENMNLKDEQVLQQTWCPICKRGELLEDHRFIYCTNCDIRLHRDNEVTLDLLRNRLAEAFEEHCERGCRLRPKFCVQTRFHLKALYISCDGCSTFEIIV